MRAFAWLAALALALVGLMLAAFTSAQPGKVGDVGVGEAGARLSIDLAGRVRGVGAVQPDQQPTVLISPDGRWRAVLHFPGMSGSTATVAIGRHDPDGPLRIVERHLYAGTGHAIWSADSRWLAMATWIPHVVSAEAVSVDGRRRLLARPFCGDFSGGPAWEPHGDRIALSVPAPGAGCRQGVDLRLQSADTGRRQVIAHGIEGNPGWSPDGRWIAIVGNGVEVMRADGTHRWAPPASSAFWAPRGDLLVLTDGNDQTLALAHANGSLRSLDSNVQWALAPAFSPDGRLVAYARWDAIVVRRVADGRVVTKVAISTVDVQRLAWAADGKALRVDAWQMRESD